METTLFFWLGRVGGFGGFDGGADRAVDRRLFAGFDMEILFVFGVNKRIVAILASEDFVRHVFFENI